MSPKRRKRRVAKAAEAAVSLKRGRPLRQSAGGLGVPKVVEVRGLHYFGNTRPPMLLGIGVHSFGDTGASTALGQGLPPLWGRGLRSFRDTGASAALRTPGHWSVWGHRGLCHFGAPASAASGKPGPLLLLGMCLEMSNSHTPTRSEEACILDHPPRHGCKRHQEHPHQHAEPQGNTDTDPFLLRCN